MLTLLMANKKNTKTMKITRTIGILGVPFFMMVAFMIAGGNPKALIHVSVLVCIIGMTLFGLLATFGATTFSFVGNGFLALFTKPEPNPLYVKIATAGSRYAMGSGVLGLVFRRY